MIHGRHSQILALQCPLCNWDFQPGGRFLHLFVSGFDEIAVIVCNEIWNFGIQVNPKRLVLSCSSGTVAMLFQSSSHKKSDGNV